ncbi:hypothetical protein LCI18_011372 [Fusarium solani-melongenae]|uniref:Uncharacterized protein n=1 Tax=Fusarium solani subsp. cucurbitae TaxID=2747967 RepID=A0ACD3ZHM5_FUSSC|nr:hypothetical protein LCI18_011372 [Fusarium solani-melongenae]
MEAAGLAVGVVALGLQLATTLQTYAEGVAGAEDRLRELSFDVASTASTLKQLRDMLDADNAVVEKTSPGQSADPVTIFTDQGRRDIYSLSRRCEKVYQGILRVIVGASAPPSATGKSIARNVGLSDLTATRLIQFSRDLKWPWVEPRVKACQEELRWLKVDLLLHLQVATVARTHLQQSPEQVANLDDESTIEAVAERLISQRAAYRKAALDGRRQRKSLANAANTSGSARSPVSDDTMKQTTRGNTLVTSSRSFNLVDKENISRDLNSTLRHGNSRSSSSHSGKVGMFLGYRTEAIKEDKDTNDPFDIEAWTLPPPGVEPRRLPFKREAIIQRMQLAVTNGDVSAWDQFLALTPEQRDQAQDLIAQSRKADARPRSYLGLETREDEIIVFVAVSQHEEVVYLTDTIGRTWKFPYKNFKSWPVAKEHISLLEAKDASMGHEITDGHFDIRAESGALIQPMLWHQFVRPGKRLEMVMRREEDPSTRHSSSSSKAFFDKAVLKRLFTFSRRSHVQRMQLTYGGALTPAITPGISRRPIMSTLSTSKPIMSALPTRKRIHPALVLQDNWPQEVESTEMEIDTGDLFEFSDEEELDPAETFGQLLSRLTNAHEG